MADFERGSVSKMKFSTVFTIIAISVVYCKNPGLKTRITDAGLTYADQVAIGQLSKSAVGQKIPDQSGKSGDVTYEISNIVIKSFSVPSSSIDVVADGLNWKASGLELSSSGHFHYKLHKFISGSGSVDVSVSGVTFDIGISLGVDSTGRPKIGSNGCSCDIGSVHVKFHGGAAQIYNLFKGLVKKTIKKLLNKQLCSTIKNAVDVDGSKALAKLKVTVDVGKVFLLDYRFIGKPAFNPQHFLETYHKGEFYWASSISEAPFDPISMPAFNSTQKMFYIWMSDYTFNTLTYQAQKHGMLAYNLTQKDLPAKAKDFLNTTCNGIPCIGKIIPQIGQKYPNNQVQMVMSSGFAPNISVAEGKVNVLFGGTITMTTTKGDNFLLALNATMSISVTLDVKNQSIYANIGDMSIVLHVIKSDVGQISDIVLNVIANTAIIGFVKPQLNKLGAKGIPLPLTNNIQFVNTEITLDKDTIMIGTDLKYQ